jgi:hypothetical protein
MRSGATNTFGLRFDSVTKLVISFYVGRREAGSANAFVRDLSQRIEGRFQLTTDGLRWYVPAVDEYLGGNCDFAQLIKLYSSHDITGPEWYGATSRVTGTIPSHQKRTPRSSLYFDFAHRAEQLDRKTWHPRRLFNEKSM